MSQYIDTEIEKIIKTEEFEYPLNTAMSASWLLSHFKGVNIKVFDTKGTSSLSDFYVIASMQNDTQARSCADSIAKQMIKHGVEVKSVEGESDCEWILIDLGDIIVHIFQETSRDIFSLDQMWLKMPQVKIPEEYYMAEKMEEKPKESGPTGYF
jgi:ribosome-associated protein